MSAGPRQGLVTQPGPPAHPLAGEDSGIWTDSPLPRLHTGGEFHMRQLGGFCQKWGVGAGPANTADVRSGLLHQGCAIGAKQPQGWFPGAQSGCLAQEPAQSTATGPGKQRRSANLCSELYTRLGSCSRHARQVDRGFTREGNMS